MGAPITIKRRAVTVKAKAAPQAIKPAETDEPTVDADAEESTPEETADAPVFVSAPKPTGGRGNTSATATAVAAIAALIAVLIFLFLLLLQWTEFRELSPLFPRPVPIGLILAVIPW